MTKHSNTTGVFARHQGNPAQTIGGFDYAAIDPALAAEIRASVEIIREGTRRFTSSIAAIGRELTAVKEKIPHGEWLPWLDAEFQMTDRTARNYMNAGKFLEGKSATVSVLPPGSLYALSAPSAPPEVVAEVVAEVERGVIPKVEEIRERIAGVFKAQQAAAAAAARSAEQIKKDRENEKRRRAREEEQNRKYKEQQAEDERSRDKRAEELATWLFSKLGAGGIVELMEKFKGTDWYKVQRHFCHRDGTHTGYQLTAEKIDAKFRLHVVKEPGLSHAELSAALYVMKYGTPDENEAVGSGEATVGAILKQIFERAEADRKSVAPPEAPLPVPRLSMAPTGRRITVWPDTTDGVVP